MRSKPEAVNATAKVGTNGGSVEIGHGAVVIAAITSCTNTSNPSVMVAAGLVARKAVEKGLTVKPYVKTSLAPGSRVVTDYLKRAGLIEPLSQLGFNIVAYGCTTCIGNSGPLPGEVAKAVTGATSWPSPCSPAIATSRAASIPLCAAATWPRRPLVVAFALAGRVDIDLDREPLGTGADGKPVFLKDLWPSQAEIAETMARSVQSGMFTEKYAAVFEGSEMWKAIKVPEGGLYQWDEASTYIHHPPYFQDLTREVPPLQPIKGARVLAMFGRLHQHRQHLAGWQHRRR